MKKFMERRIPSSFKIQITSMVDMFVILLVFLLKSYSTSPVNINPNKDLRLPQSVAEADPIDVVKIVVSKTGIFIDDKKIMDLNNGEFIPQDLDPNDDHFVTSLYKALDEQAQVTKYIAGKNEAVEFDGKILMQADKDLNYSVLQKVFYTSMLAGYSDMKLAVVAKN
jgi:biopolymer transport protein ExbD